MEIAANILQGCPHFPQLILPLEVDAIITEIPLLQPGADANHLLQGCGDFPDDIIGCHKQQHKGHQGNHNHTGIGSRGLSFVGFISSLYSSIADFLQLIEAIFQSIQLLDAITAIKLAGLIHAISNGKLNNLQGYSLICLPICPGICQLRGNRLIILH